MEEIDYLHAIHLLEKEYLQNIIMLKHAFQLKRNAQYFTTDNTILIRFISDQMHHDKQLYPEYNSINLLSRIDNVHCILQNLEAGVHIIKVNGILNDAEYTLLRSFQSLTTNKAIDLKILENIEKVNPDQLDRHAYLFGLIGYTITDVEKMIKNSSAYVVSVEHEMEPICSCVIYNVYKNIWEISALATSEKHRRKHYAAQLVAYATHELLSKGLIPRYHVHMDNTASYNLAIKCGYEPFIHFNHYSFTKAK